MANIHQAEKAKKFLELHNNNKLLILPNIWEPYGARILEANGYPAAATASAAISSMLGYRDGEQIKLSTHLDIIRRIAASVNIPVTADVESGYGATLDELKNSAVQILDTGAAGINIEDSILDGTELREAGEQCERLALIREISGAMNIHLVINARTDCFMIKGALTEQEKSDEAVRRAEMYIGAGADCIFLPGLTNKDSIINLRSRIKSPINIFASPKAPSLKELQEIGINRVSFGPQLFRSCMKKFENITRQLYKLGDYNCFSKEMLSYNENLEYLNEGGEK